MPNIDEVFPATYSTATNRQCCERWTEKSIDEGVDFIMSFALDMLGQGTKFRKGITSRTKGQTFKANEEDFYGAMACACRILRRRHHIEMDYKVLKKKRCVGQKKTASGSYVKYDWSYSIDFVCFDDDEWEAVRCRCDDEACVDHTPVPATTQTPTKEEENPI